MSSSGEEKLYLALKSSERGIRDIVSSLSSSEREEWDRIFREHPIAGVPLGQYGLKVLGPLAKFIVRKISGEVLQEAAEHIANEVASEALSEFGAFLVADAHLPGTRIAAKMAFLAYKVEKVRLIFYDRSLSQDVGHRVANTMQDVIGGREARKAEKDAVRKATRISSTWFNNGGRMPGGLV